MKPLSGKRPPRIIALSSAAPGLPLRWVRPVGVVRRHDGRRSIAGPPAQMMDLHRRPTRCEAVEADLGTPPTGGARGGGVLGVRMGAHA